MATRASFKTIEDNNRIDTILNKDFVSGGIIGFVEFGEEKFCLPITFKDHVERIRKFKVRDDDVILAAYPKTGTTWTNEMLWMLVNNLNYEGATEVLQLRSPLLEYSTCIDPSIRELVDVYEPDSITHVENLKSPRCIKTHLPWPLLPDEITMGVKKPKIITVMRNPQDVCLSMYHHGKLFGRYRGDSTDEFFDVFLAGRRPFWKHISSFWNQRHNTNILFIKYKDMKEDLPSVIKTVANFLDKSLKEEEVVKLAKHLSFASMKKNSAVNRGPMFNKLNIQCDATAEDNGFIRRGKEGGYKTEMSPEVIEMFEKWTKENILDTEIDLW